MNVMLEGRGVASRAALKTDSGAIGITARLTSLKHQFIHRQRKALIYVAMEGSDEALKRERISRMPTGHLGGLGGLTVSILEIEKLHALHP